MMYHEAVDSPGKRSAAAPVTFLPNPEVPMLRMGEGQSPFSTLSRYRLFVASQLIVALVIVLIGCSTEANEHYDAGVRLHKEGRVKEALAEYFEAIQLDPLFCDGLLQEGPGLCRSGRA